jgi:hypothetical protein
MRFARCIWTIAALAVAAGEARAQSGGDTPLSSVSFDETRVTRAASSRGRWAYMAGDTVGEGNSVIGAELGWPDLTLAFVYGTGARTDVGIKAQLIYGTEGTTETQFGFGLKAPVRMNMVKKDKFSLLLHGDPGIKLYAGSRLLNGIKVTPSKLAFGFTLPVGVQAAYSPNRAVSVGVGADLDFSVFVAGYFTPAFIIAPMFGPEVEYRIDDEVAIGLNTRFGPMIAIGSDDFENFGAFGTAETQTKFAFRVQLVLAYKL